MRQGGFYFIKALNRCRTFLKTQINIMSEFIEIDRYNFVADRRSDTTSIS